MRICIFIITLLSQFSNARIVMNKTYSEKNSHKTLQVSNFSDPRNIIFGVFFLSHYQLFDNALKSKGFQFNYDAVEDDGTYYICYFGQLNYKLPQMNIHLWASPITKRVYKVKFTVDLLNYMIDFSKMPYSKKSVVDYYELWDDLSLYFRAKYGEPSFVIEDKYEGLDIDDLLREYYIKKENNEEDKYLYQEWVYQPIDQKKSNDKSMKISMYIDKETGRYLKASIGINDDFPGMFTDFKNELETESKKWLGTQF